MKEIVSLTSRVPSQLDFLGPGCNFKLTWEPFGLASKQQAHNRNQLIVKPCHLFFVWLETILTGTTPPIISCRSSYGAFVKRDACSAIPLRFQGSLQKEVHSYYSSQVCATSESHPSAPHPRPTKHCRCRSSDGSSGPVLGFSAKPNKSKACWHTPLLQIFRPSENPGESGWSELSGNDLKWILQSANELCCFSLNWIAWCSCECDWIHLQMCNSLTECTTCNYSTHAEWNSFWKYPKSLGIVLDYRNFVKLFSSVHWHAWPQVAHPLCCPL
jgi:hypothetical protein